MNKKIVITESIAGFSENGEPFGYAPGSTQDVQEEIAHAWVQAGLATWPSKDKPKAEAAVAKAPEAAKVVVPDAKVETPKVETKDEPKTESK